MFSFEKLADVDTLLGPEMKSTGEVLGVAGTLSEALYKGLVAAGYQMDRRGGVLFSVKRTDRREIYDTAKRFLHLGCTLYATPGNARALRSAGLPVTEVQKLSTGDDAILRLMDEGTIAYVVSTSSKGRIPTRDSVRIRRKAVEKSIPCLTSIDTANALADSMESRYSQLNTELVDLNHRRRHRERLRFSKMQASGNDYLCFDCRRQRIDNPAGLAVRLSERHFGIGAEGVCLLYPSDRADFRMVVYNLDGTAATMGGNAIGCLAKYAYDRGIIPPERLSVSVETAGGVRAVRLYKRNGIVRAAEVAMGRARFESVAVPVELPVPRVLDYAVDVGRGYRITCVNVGNPHAVAFVEDVDTLDVASEGPLLEHASIFPERVNAEFVRVLDETTLRMRVWERGSGETWACGTGACAAVAAAVENGLCAADTDIAVKVPGGVLSVRYSSDGSLHMRGEVDLVFEGVVEL